MRCLYGSVVFRQRKVDSHKGGAVGWTDGTLFLHLTPQCCFLRAETGSAVLSCFVFLSFFFIRNEVCVQAFVSWIEPYCVSFLDIAVPHHPFLSSSSPRLVSAAPLMVRQIVNGVLALKESRTFDHCSGGSSRTSDEGNTQIFADEMSQCHNVGSGRCGSARQARYCPA